MGKMISKEEFPDLHAKFESLRINAKIGRQSKRISPSMYLDFNINSAQLQDTPGTGYQVTADFFYMMEVTNTDSLYHYIISLQNENLLLSTIRRKAGQGAADYLLDLCQNDLNKLPKTSQTMHLLQVSLAGYASKANALTLLSNQPHVFDKSQLVSACSHAGNTYLSLLNMAEDWFPCLMIKSSLSFNTEAISYKTKPSLLRKAYASYKENPTNENAAAVTLYLLPVAMARVYMSTKTLPSLEKAQQVFHIASHHGSGYCKAVRQYMRYIQFEDQPNSL